jgi:hypothetical protein
MGADHNNLYESAFDYAAGGGTDMAPATAAVSLFGDY